MIIHCAEDHFLQNHSFLQFGSSFLIFTHHFPPCFIIQPESTFHPREAVLHFQFVEVNLTMQHLLYENTTFRLYHNCTKFLVSDESIFSSKKCRVHSRCKTWRILFFEKIWNHMILQNFVARDISEILYAYSIQWLSMYGSLLCTTILLLRYTTVVENIFNIIWVHLFFKK